MDAEIETIFCKYDLDGDRLLKCGELMMLVIDIKRAKANLVEEFVNFKEKRKVNERIVDEFM
jgi:hypothetical protein